MKTIKKECEVIRLPSNNRAYAGQLCLSPKPAVLTQIAANNHNNKVYDVKPQQLYVVSDDVIKEGDWVISKLGSLSQVFGFLGRCKEEGYKKVIATDNINIKMFTGIQNLANAPSHPHLPQSFIEEYVESYNNGSPIEKVMVEYEKYYHDEFGGNNHGYRLKINPKNNTITIKQVKDSWSREEIVELLYKSRFHIKSSDEKFDKWIEENL